MKKICWEHPRALWKIGRMKKKEKKKSKKKERVKREREKESESSRYKVTAKINHVFEYRIRVIFLKGETV